MRAAIYWQLRPHFSDLRLVLLQGRAEEIPTMAVFRYLLSVAAGLITPIRITSRLYLQDQLSRCGVGGEQIPEACLQELANYRVATSKRIAEMTLKKLAHEYYRRLGDRSVADCCNS